MQFSGRFIFETDKDKQEQNKWVLKILNKKYEINEIVKGDSIFCATGITSGDIINGIKKDELLSYRNTCYSQKSKFSK